MKEYEMLSDFNKKLPNQRNNMVNIIIVLSMVSVVITCGILIIPRSSGAPKSLEVASLVAQSCADHDLVWAGTQKYKNIQPVETCANTVCTTLGKNDVRLCPATCNLCRDLACKPIVVMKYTGNWGGQALDYRIHSEWGEYRKALGPYVLDHYGDDGRPVYRTDQKQKTDYGQEGYLWLYYSTSTTSGNRWIVSKSVGGIVKFERYYARSVDTEAMCPTAVSSWEYNILGWQNDGKHVVDVRENSYWTERAQTGGEVTQCQDGFVMTAVRIEGSHRFVSCQLAPAVPALNPQSCGQILYVSRKVAGEREDNMVGRSVGAYIPIEGQTDGQQVYEYVGPSRDPARKPILFYDKSDTSWKIGDSDKTNVWVKSSSTTAPCPSDAGGWLTLLDDWTDLQTSVTKTESYSQKNQQWYKGKYLHTISAASCEPGFVVVGLIKSRVKFLYSIRCAPWDAAMEPKWDTRCAWRLGQCASNEAALGMRNRAELFCCRQSQNLYWAYGFLATVDR